MVSFKELCGLTPAANMKQCILTVSTWLMNSERALRVTVDLSETYPSMEAQGPVPELLRKVLNAYDMVNREHAYDMLYCWLIGTLFMSWFTQLNVLYGAFKHVKTIHLSSQIVKLQLFIV